jgi:hypothetical protein
VAWNFPDRPDTGVYTTRQVFDEGALLSLVSHDPGGDWQFLHDGDDDDESELRDEDDLIYVQFGHLVDRFPETRQLADLPIGWMATRETAGEPWLRAPQPKEWATG